MTLIDLADRLDRTRIYWFGKYWLFGPFSLTLFLLSSALKASTNSREMES